MLINLICLSFSIWNNFNIIYILIHQRLNHIFIYMVSDFKSLSLLYNTINSITEYSTVQYSYRTKLIAIQLLWELVQ